MSGTGAGHHVVIMPTIATGLLLPPRSIPSSSSGDSSFSLEDKEKRWLVVGICLNKLLLPALRQYLDPEMMKHYHTMKAAFKIHSQKYPAQLPKDKTFQLNYGSINSNDTNHKKKVAHYDYNVTSSIDLAKLYLKPNMAKLSGFDNSCDMSAALGILAAASVFSPDIQKNATDVRQDVRNEWGHCNFDKWNEVKFGRCFQLMETFLRNLNLSHREEKRLTDELADWEAKGLQLCMGTLVDADLMKLVKNEVANLSMEIELIQQNNEEEAHRVTSELQKVLDAIHKYETELVKVKEQVVSLELSRDQHSQQLEDLSGACANLSTGVGSLKSRQDDIEIEVSGMKKNEQDLIDEVSEARASREKLSGRIESVEEKQEDLEGRVGALEIVINPIRSSQSINTFQIPDKIPCFCGRAGELKALAKPLEVTAISCSFSVICGLGGTGKTSLAIEHVWINRDAYSGGVFWISGESQRLFQISITEMARQIGTHADDLTQTVSDTLHWLQTRGKYWCLVIDNLDELDLSEDMLKLLHGHWKREASGHIIITTRRERQLVREEIHDVEQEGCIELTNLSESESVSFMKIRTERTGNEEDSVTVELVRELGCLPLALDQAAAYIRCSKCTFTDYKNQYRTQKLRLLKRRKAHYPAQNTSRDRISVQTTWELNFEYVSLLSEDMELSRAASRVMEVSAFLSPDDIPHEIINEGLPQVTDDHLRVSEVLTLLTNFSLFQRFTNSSYSVHRLVQEVIRSRIKKGDLKEVLLNATRMLNFAFSQTKTPFDVCQNFEGEAVFSEANPPSLHLWGNLGAHACVLQDHLLQYSQKDQSFKESLLYTVEAARLLNEASVFLSVCQEKIKAQELQHLKLELLVHIAEPSLEHHIDYLKYFEIPLKNKDYKLISHCMAKKEMEIPQDTVVGGPVNERLLQEKADCIREEGNTAVKKNDFKKALDLYTEAINIVQTDHRLFSNRALCLLKLGQPSKALEDCEKCLRLERLYSKALQRKAWALHELANQQTDNKHIKGRSLAAAALAVHIDPTVRETPHFKLMFPNLHFYEVKNPLHLPGLLLKCAPETTLLLHNGDYKLQEVIYRNGFQIVGLGSQVSLKFENRCTFILANYCFENIILIKGSGAIVCSMFGSLTLISCTISSGFVGCEDFPECNGGPGCVAGKPCERTGMFGDCRSGISGKAGYTGIQTVGGSSGYLEDCDIRDCGGGGALSQGCGTFMTVKSCRVHKNHKAGLEAREGGRLIVTDSNIFGNGYYGVLIGPSAGTCEIVNNRIFENYGDGIFVLDSLEHELVICGNRIYHNRSFGIYLDRCQVKIARNEIFENGFWAIHAKTLTTAYIEHNEIYSNKCGAIHIDINFSGRIVITSNNVRDHSGQWLEAPTPAGSIPGSVDLRREDGSLLLPPGETKFYSTPPVVINNELKNNKVGLFHPKERAKSVERECAFCRSSAHLRRCSKCNVAAYCGRSCQEKHWPKHKALCAVMAGRYSVTVTPISYSNMVSVIILRGFGSHLKGIGKGPKPDPKRNKRFIVKVQTMHLNCHPRQLLTVYDRSLDIDCYIQSPAIFHVIMECGVHGELQKFTSKKAFFWTMFAEAGKKLTVFLDELAPYQEW